MAITHTIREILTWKNIYFSTYSPPTLKTLVPLLYQCAETHSTDVSYLLSQPLPHPKMVF
jgi:hypothetical protein